MSQKDKRTLLAHLLGWSYEKVFLENPDTNLAPEFEELWGRYKQGEPLARLLQQQTFRGRTFHITPDVLEPRIETEMILDIISAHNIPQKARFLDLGTGSGCILISALMEHTEATGVGVDVSSSALDVARQNARTHKVDARCTWLNSNWLNNVPLEPFDVIASNPPYIGTDESLPRNVTQYDPALALYGGKSGFECYEAILQNLKPYCHKETLCLFEIGYQQKEAIEELLASWSFVQTYYDLQNHPRIILFKI